MSTTPDSVQPDPRDITPDGFKAKAEDDVEGHVTKYPADEPGPDGLRVHVDEDDPEGFLRQKH